MFNVNGYNSTNAAKNYNSVNNKDKKHHDKADISQIQHDKKPEKSYDSLK